jgi:hypothetical protein
MMMTSGSEITTYPIGWCFTCDTNTCDHVAQLNLCNRIQFEKLLRDMKEPSIKLPGLTGEPYASPSPLDAQK